jgi:hypothetical protein
VALTGRVPVKVSEENGPIYAGDPLGLSDILPGYAAKLSSSGQSIGIALEDSNGGTAGTDVIMVFVSLGYEHVDVAANAAGDAIIFDKNIDLSGMALMNVKSINTIADTWSIDEAGVLAVKEIRTEKLCIGQTCVDENTLKALLEGNGLDGQEPTSSPDSGNEGQVAGEGTEASAGTDSEGTVSDPAETGQAQAPALEEGTEQGTVAEETSQTTASGTAPSDSSTQAPVQDNPESEAEPEPEPEPESTEPPAAQE